MAVFVVKVNQFLAMTQPLETNMKAADVTQTLVLTQTAMTHIKIGEVSQSLNFGHIASARYSIKNVSVSQYLSMGQHGGPTEFADVTQFFFMWQEARPVAFEEIRQTLHFVQTAEFVKTKAGSSTFVMTQTVVANVFRARSVIDTLNLTQEVSDITSDKYTSSINLDTLTGPNAPEC